MSKYIDSEKLVVEIKRLKDKYPSWQLKLAMDDLCVLITSLQQEQQEVDLEEEVRNYLKTHHLHIKDGGRVVFDNDDSPNFMCDIRDIARHFYELGLNARKED